MSDTKKLAMISQPMNGFTDNEIKATREKAIQKLAELGYDTINTYFPEEFSMDTCRNPGLKYLGKSIMSMGDVDCLYMCKDWNNFRGCKCEHEVAKAYGLEIVYEN